MAHKRTPTPPVEKIHPQKRAVQLVTIINGAIDRFTGQIDELEKAIGMLMMGDYVGWRVLVLVHSKTTLRKYETILDIKVREFFAPEGDVSQRSIGYKIATKLDRFWKVVSGDQPVPDRRGFGTNESG